ncbi:MAG: DUF3617 domain-containing protein [Betaproteobacteria bacterium]|nr:DUF3617 domain-containing protein [Betaproteobacteria bacterium]
MKYKVLGIASVALFAVTVFAEDIKPGLWEMNVQVPGMSAMQQQMASLPPAERKQMEEAMAKQGVKIGDGGMVVKACVTPEMAKRSAVPIQQQGNCTTTTSPRVGNTIKVASVCRTDPPVSVEGEVTFQGNTAYIVKTRTTTGGQTIDSQASGRWLGADCGNIEPMQ